MRNSVSLISLSNVYWEATWPVCQCDCLWELPLPVFGSMVGVACQVGRYIQEKVRKGNCSATSQSTKTLLGRKRNLSASLPMCCLVEEEERGSVWA